MNDRDTTVRAYYNFPAKAIDFLVENEREGTVGKPIEMEPVNPADRGKWWEPTFRLSMEAGQHLMDALWACGLRPIEGAGSAGQLKATERHLEDMRRLVFEHGATKV